MESEAVLVQDRAGGGGGLQEEGLQRGEGLQGEGCSGGGATGEGLQGEGLQGEGPPHSTLDPGSHLLALVVRWGNARGTAGRSRSTSAIVAVSRGSCARFLYRIWEPESLGPSLRSNSSCSRFWI